MNKRIFIGISIITLTVGGYYGYNFFFNKEPLQNVYKDISQKVNEQKTNTELKQVSDIKKREANLLPAGNLTTEDLNKKTFANKDNINIINTILTNSSFYKSIQVENNEKWIKLVNGKYVLTDYLVYSFKIKGNKQLYDIFNLILQNGKGNNGYYIINIGNIDYLVDIRFNVVAIKKDGILTKDNVMIGKSVLDLF